MPGPPVPRPDYAAAAPSDWLGSRAVRVMLEDIDFPRTVGELRERAGEWRVPATSAVETVTLGRLLDAFRDDERFDSADDAADAIRRRHHGF